MILDEQKKSLKIFDASDETTKNEYKKQSNKKMRIDLLIWLT